MFRNYLIVALRNLARHKLYSFINIAGLTVGLTCAIFVILFVRDQLSYDRWIPGTENLYRVENTLNLPGKPPAENAKTPFAAPQAMLDQIPEVLARTRLTLRSKTIVVGDRQFPERVDVVDPNFLQVIQLPLVSGDAASVFAKPESAVLSEATARKYFGDASPLGKTIVMSGQHCDDSYQNCQVQQQALVVTGVLKDLPHNTQLKADVMIPNTSAASPVNQEMRENWMFISSWGYVRLAPGADPNMVTAKLRTVIDHAVDAAKRANVHEPGSKLLAPRLTPFVDAHLSTDRFGGMTPPGSWTIVYGFSAIGTLILLIACFNFTNLATARALMRAREISLRKVVGATRRQLVIQFLGEALMTAAIALAFALALTEVLLPLFDRVLGLPIEIDYFRNWQLLLLIVGAGALAGLLSGAYPALVLSGFRPAATLRANRSGPAGSGRLRTVLVVLQFAVSIGLGIAAAVIFAQISFTRNVDLGFRKDAVVVVNTAGIPPGTADSLARALRLGSDIGDVATSDAVPFSDDHNNISAHAPGATSSEEFALVPASPDFMHLYGIKLLAGRLLSEQRGGDGVSPDQLQGKGVQPANVLINATAARRMGYGPQAAVGKTLTLDAFGGISVTVVGVVADIKEDGPKSPVDGTMYMYWRSFPLGHLSVRIRDGREQQGLAFIDRTWHAFAPSVAIQRHFLDDDYDRQFQADERQGTLFGVFVGIAIFIACLGLFGLAAFSTQRRTREIGVRKVFGARVRDVVLLLLWQFSLPVLMANAIAWPVAWYYLHGWLQGFAYRIALSPLYFVGAGATAMVIAWATVFIHARRVAGANPIHALRYE
ncbi:MAG TPA: ABC transporter permease [Rhizomicrobium sp.]|jgi:putative ABC transport system permease protein